MHRLLFVLPFLLTACSGGSAILPAGPDTFTVTEHRAPILGGALKAREAALLEANAHCASRGAVFLPISGRESTFPPGNPWGNTNYTLTFRCVSAEAAEHTEPAMQVGPGTGSSPASEVGWHPAARMPSQLRTAALRGTELFKLVSPSVYLVAATNDLERGSQGSAVAVSASVLITNCHVIAKYTHVFLRKGQKIGTASLVSADIKSDKCFLETRDMKLTPIRGVRSFYSIEVGEEAFALGNPQSLELTFSPGVISGKRHSDGVDLLQTTAPIAPGSSGGGLFDAKGNLMGITTFNFKGEGDLNFAIAADAFWH